MSIPTPSSVEEVNDRRTERDGDRTIQVLCAWSGVAATLLVFLGLVVIGKLIPARDPEASGEEIANWYSDNADQVRVGMVIAMVGFTLFVSFGIAIALQIRRTQNKPVLTYIQIACVAIGTLEAVCSSVVWATAAFRPDDIDPDITRALNDLGWYFFLFDVPPFTMWMAAIGIAILRDRSVAPVFPRWLGYFNLWAALFFSPAMLIAFFKDRPFAFDGVFALYLPVVVFFSWIVVMTPPLLNAINRQEAAR